MRSQFANMDPGNPLGQAPVSATSNDNLRLSQFNIGGTGQSGLVLHQNEYNYYSTPNYQRVIFTFYNTYPDHDRDQRVFLTDFELTVPPTGCP